MALLFIQGDPTPLPTVPDTMFNYPPEGMTVEAAAIWDWYGDNLPMSIKTYFKLHHIRLFADMCELEAWLVRNHFKDEPATVVNRMGDAKMNPALTAWMFVWNQVQKIRKELAIHPMFCNTLDSWQRGALFEIPGDGNVQMPSRIQYFLPENGRRYEGIDEEEGS
jgi:hypothetical protein